MDSANVGSTVTLQVADKFEPSAVVAVIIASPTAIAVTRPFSSTVATASFDESQKTVLSVVYTGSTVAVNSAVCVTSRLISLLSRVIDSACVATTVTLHEADKFEPSVVVAVIIQFPSLTPKIVAVPSIFSRTTAIFASSDFHIVRIFEASAGDIIQEIFIVSFFLRIISVELN